MRRDARQCACSRPAPTSARAHVCAAYTYALPFVCLCDALIGRMAAQRSIHVRSGRLKATQSTPNMSLSTRASQTPLVVPADVTEAVMQRLSPAYPHGVVRIQARVDPPT